MPQWLKAMIERGSSLEEIVAMLVARVQKRATTPRDALVIANEIGRSPDGGALIHRHLTEELLTGLVRTVEGGDR